MVLARLLMLAAKGSTELQDTLLTQLVLLYHLALELLPHMGPSADTGMCAASGHYCHAGSSTECETPDTAHAGPVSGMGPVSVSPGWGTGPPGCS